MDENGDLMIDVGRRWDAKTAVIRINGLEDIEPYFVEEPVSPDDYDGLKKVASNCPSTRVVTGEKFETRFAFKNLIESTGIDGIQPDLGYVGGITEMKRIIEMADLYGVPVYPHMWGTEILGYATLQVAATSRNVPYMEYCLEKSNIRYPVGEPIDIKDGKADLPEDPELGFDLDEKVMKKYLVDGNADG